MVVDAWTVIDLSGESALDRGLLRVGCTPITIAVYAYLVPVKGYAVCLKERFKPITVEFVAREIIAAAKFE